MNFLLPRVKKILFFFSMRKCSRGWVREGVQKTTARRRRHDACISLFSLHTGTTDPLISVCIPNAASGNLHIQVALLSGHRVVWTNMRVLAQKAK